MPVEIKELVIRIVAREGAGQGAVQSTQSGNETPESVDPDTLVQACVRHVLAILEKKKKR